MKKYVIIPGCSDLNRGDQALVWEAMRIAKDMGCEGDFYLTADTNEPTGQSEKAGLNIVPLILEHPSRFTKDKDNIHYGLKIKLKWGFIAVFDFFESLLYFHKFTRKFMKKIMPHEKLKTLIALEEADKVFVKGGGFIHAYGGVTAPYFVYFSLYHIMLALAMKKDVYILPNSYGPFEGLGVKWMIKNTFKKCKFVSTREGISQEMVKRELGLDVDLFPDLAFFLEKRNLSKKEIFEKFNLSNKRKLVAITMRPYRFPKSQNPIEKYNSFKHEMRNFIEWLYNEGFMPVVIEHTLAMNSHENDGDCIRDVVKGLDDYKYRIIEDVNYDCKDLKGIYSVCDYIIGTRFHSVIFSVAEGKPGIAITYGGNKGKGIMKAMDLEDLAIAIEDVSCKELKEKFEYILLNEDDVKNRINNYVDFTKKERERLITRLNR